MPKLFAIEAEREEDEAVAHEFSAFLRDYISRCDLTHVILKKIDDILVRKETILFYLLESHKEGSQHNIPPMFSHFSLPRIQLQASWMVSSSWFWQ